MYDFDMIAVCTPADTVRNLTMDEINLGMQTVYL